MSHRHQVEQLHRTAHRVAEDINRRLEPSADVTVTHRLETLYRSLPDVTLILLREGFKGDRDQQGQASSTRAFCQSRIDLITRILERT